MYDNQELAVELKKMMKAQFTSSKKVLEEYGLYVGQPQFMFTLLKEEGLSQKDIAQRLGIKPATVNVTLKRLEKGGLVEKRLDEKNKRASKVYLTDKGKDICLEVKDVMNERSAKLFSVLSDDEKMNFKKILEKLNKNIEVL